MRKLLWLLVIALGVGGTAADAWGQTGGITGQVVDRESRRALAGAQVFVTNTNLNTLTDQNGRYVLPNVPAGEQTVRTVLIGYAQGEIPVTVTAGETAVADFELRLSAVGLDELVVSVVTGQTQRKRELGTNTATIGSGEIDRAPITRFADVLTARVAGVQLQGVAGTVGTSQRIRIRGANSISLSNEPLIYLDGVQFSNNKGGMGVGGQDYSRLNDLNPEDIESIEVLKGPAASSLYGTAAANGVIRITTKRGAAGAPQWRAYVEVGRSEDRNPWPTNYLPFQVLDPNQPMFSLPRGRLNPAGYQFCPNESVARGVCTQDQILRINPFDTDGLNPFSNGNRQQYGVSVAGGSDDVTYFISGDFTNEQGVISFNEQDRLNLRVNLDARITEKLDLSVRTGYTRGDLALNANDNNIFSPIINALLATPVVPTPEQREAGPPQQRFGTGFGFYLEDIENIVTLQELDRFVVNSSARFRPLSWLTVNGNVGMDYFTRSDAETVQPGRLPIAATFTPGFRDAERTTNYIWTSNAAGIASYQLGDELSATTTLGGSFSRQLQESTGCFGVGIVEGTRSCTATSSLKDVNEDFFEIRTIGGWLQQQFNWRDRVFVGGAVRGDDDSAFGQEFGLIYYPAANLSWVLSEESFFPQLDFLSNLRLRGAIGRSGQRPQFRDAITLFEPVAVSTGGDDVSAVGLNRVGNPDLKPERTTEWEAGFDLGLLQERVSLEFTYFNKDSKDALVSRPLPPSFGLTGDVATTGSIFVNLGSVRNWGTEIALNARVLNTRNVDANLRLSATTLDNEIEELGEGVEPIIFSRGAAQRHEEGFPTGAFFGRRIEWSDPDGDGLLTRDDVRAIDDEPVFLGHALPTNTQMVSGDITLFGNVTISTLFERRGGNFQLNDTERFRCQTGYNNGLNGAGQGNCVGVADPNASLFEQARFIANRFDGNVVGYIEESDFIKWRELSVSLGLPASLTGATQAGGGGGGVRQFLRSATLTLSGRNLRTWTDYTGLDPEINETGGDSNFIQREFNTQPQIRYYTIRLNFAF